MTSARKTSAILVTASAVCVGALLLSTANRPTPAKSHARPTAQSAAGLTMLARPMSSHVATGRHEAHVAVSVTAPADSSEERPTADVAIVLDTSGSMDGPKLAHAAAAARGLIASLSPRDSFSLIIYGSEVRTLTAQAPANEDTKAAALRALDHLYTDGGTNLSGGLLAGRAQLASRGGASISRIVLISDGQANEGIVHGDDLAALAQTTANEGMSITTLGVGLDFDEQTMTRIAVSGRGNYYFAESGADMASLFQRELDRVGKTVATDMSLTIRPAPGVELLDAYGYPVKSEGALHIVPVADMAAGETRKVVLRMMVSADHPGERELADIRTEFRRAGEIDRHSLRAQVSVTATDDLELVAEGRDLEAVRHIERARTAVTINQATELYEQGKMEDARRLIHSQRKAAQAVAADLGDDDFAEEMGAAADRSMKNFESASAPASSAGKKARKSNRKDAYDLLH